MKDKQDNPVAIRISIVNDNCSIPHSEWLQYNDKFKDLGIVFEISDKGYLSMVMTPTVFANMDLIGWIKIGEGSMEDRIYDRLSVYLDMQTFLHRLFSPLHIPSTDNIIDLYMTPQSEHYYLDSQCSNAAVLMFTDKLFPLTEVRDMILKSFKVNVYRDENMMLVDCGRESRDITIGRIQRMASLYLLQMGIPTSNHVMSAIHIAYINDKGGLTAIYMY